MSTTEMIKGYTDKCFGKGKAPFIQEQCRELVLTKKHDLEIAHLI